MQTHVTAAKAAIDALSGNASIELGPRGITSNIIAPGPIEGTEGMERLARKESAEAAHKLVPSGRYGTVREIADATVFLFGDTGSYVNGTNLVGKFPPYIVLLRVQH
jgi:2,4-dienoyl-CoA reductase [(3E)-enoyl-CoA-producing], peroxisomal